MIKKLSILSKKFNREWLEFVVAMTDKELKSRYKYAFLGFIWLVLNPILQMLIIGLVFEFFIPRKVDNYYLFLLSGLLPWNFFSYSLIKAIPSIVHERNLIQKAKFPRESIVLSIIFSNLFNLIISFVMLVALLLVDKVMFEQYTLVQFAQYSMQILLVIPALIWLLVLTISFGLLLAALNVRYRDINLLAGALLPLWFYATPIIYDLQFLPQRYRMIAYLNPITPIIELFHYSLLNQPPAHGQFWLVGGFMTIVLAVIAVVVFRKESKFFDDWI